MVNKLQIFSQELKLSRCIVVGFYTVSWFGTFSVLSAGGYDRGECLVSVEVYNTAKGRWSKLPNMLTPRARFGAAALRGRMYAVGGSDGARDLDSVHYFSFESLKWKTAASLNTARSSCGELMSSQSALAVVKKRPSHIYLVVDGRLYIENGSGM